MTDEDLKAFENLVHPVVRDVYAEEEAFVLRRIAAARKAGKSFIQELLTWAPYVGDIFEENEIGAAQAMSDVNQQARAGQAIERIERGLNTKLDDDTKANIRVDLNEIYNFTSPDE